MKTELVYNCNTARNVIICRKGNSGALFCAVHSCFLPSVLPFFSVMAWWDYGYQIAGFAKRSTIVDNNTWNNSHIALVRHYY